MKNLLFPIESDESSGYKNTYLGLIFDDESSRILNTWVHVCTVSQSYAWMINTMGKAAREPVTVTFPVPEGGRLYFFSPSFQDSILPNGESVRHCLKRNHHCEITDLINPPPGNDVDVLMEIYVRSCEIRFLIMPKRFGPVFRTAKMNPQEVFGNDLESGGWLAKEEKEG